MAMFRLMCPFLRVGLVLLFLLLTRQYLVRVGVVLV